MKKITFLLFMICSYSFAISESNIIIKGDVILDKTGFKIAYSTNKKGADAVFYKLTKSQLNGTNKRLSNFKAELNVKSKFRSSNYDYKKTIYDRGHLVNAEDMSYSAESMYDSFSLANVVPQVADFNRGIWLRAETFSRLMVKQYGELIIITGCIYPTNDKRIGANKIAVPSHMYKIIVSPDTNSISLIFKNTNYKGTDSSKNLGDYVTSVSKIQYLSKQNFFTNYDWKFKKKVYKMNHVNFQ